MADHLWQKGATWCKMSWLNEIGFDAAAAMDYKWRSAGAAVVALEV